MICEHLDLSDETGRGHLKKLLYRIFAQPPLLNYFIVSNTLRLMRRLEGRDTHLVERVAEIIAERCAAHCLPRIQQLLLCSPRILRLLLLSNLFPHLHLPSLPLPASSAIPSCRPARTLRRPLRRPLSDAEPGAATANEAEARGVAGAAGLTVTVAAIADAPAAADVELSPRTKLKQKRYEIQIATVNVKIYERRMALEAAVQVQDFELAAKLKGTVSKFLNFNLLCLLVCFHFVHTLFKFSRRAI